MKEIMKRPLLLFLFSAAVLIICFTIFRRMKRAQAESAIKDKNVRAFLDMISYAEGTQSPIGSGYGNNGYRYLFTSEYDNELLFDISSGWVHPNQVITANGIPSTAAGRYQILHRTWAWMGQGLLGLTDFSPASQDLCAVGLINYRGALELVIAGHFEEAVDKCKKEWASLPGANYPGQGMRSMASLKQKYLAAGGNIA